jgi:methionyl-tRNA formyltransferase
MPVPQTGTPTLAPSLKKDDGRIRWGEQSAADVVNLVRGTLEWPGAYSVLRGQRVKIRAAQVSGSGRGEAGTILALEKGRGFFGKMCRRQPVCSPRSTGRKKRNGRGQLLERRPPGGGRPV